MVTESEARNSAYGMNAVREDRIFRRLVAPKCRRCPWADKVRMRQLCIAGSAYN